jgi:hypothetical protein
MSDASSCPSEQTIGLVVLHDTAQAPLGLLVPEAVDLLELVQGHRERLFGLTRE